MITKKTQYITWTIILLFSFVYLSHDVLIHPATDSLHHDCSHHHGNNESGKTAFNDTESKHFDCPFCTGFLDSHSIASVAENTAIIDLLDIIENSQFNEPVPGISASRAPPVC